MSRLAVAPVSLPILADFPVASSPVKPDHQAERLQGASAERSPMLGLASPDFAHGLSPATPRETLRHRTRGSPANRFLLGIARKGVGANVHRHMLVSGESFLANHWDAACLRVGDHAPEADCEAPCPLGRVSLGLRGCRHRVM